VVQAERLHELAFELEESIGGFNLDGQKLAAQNPARPARPAGNGAAAQRALPGGRPGAAERRSDARVDRPGRGAAGRGAAGRGAADDGPPAEADS
jgi:hypothetical protein